MRLERARSDYRVLSSLGYDSIPESLEEIETFVDVLRVEDAHLFKQESSQIKKTIAKLLKALHAGGFENYMAFRYPAPPQFNTNTFNEIQAFLESPKRSTPRISLTPDFPTTEETDLWPKVFITNHSVIDFIKARFERESLGTGYTNAWASICRTNTSVKYFNSEKKFVQSVEKLKKQFSSLGSCEFQPSRSFQPERYHEEVRDSDTIWAGLKIPVLQGNEDGPTICCISFYYSQYHTKWIPHRLFLISLVRESNVFLDF